MCVCVCVCVCMCVCVCVLVFWDFWFVVPDNNLCVRLLLLLLCCCVCLFVLGLIFFYLEKRLVDGSNLFISKFVYVLIKVT